MGVEFRKLESSGEIGIDRLGAGGDCRDGRGEMRMRMRRSGCRVAAGVLDGVEPLDRFQVLGVDGAAELSGQLSSTEMEEGYVNALVADGAFAELHSRLSESEVVQNAREAENVTALGLAATTVVSCGPSRKRGSKNEPSSPPSVRSNKSDMPVFHSRPPDPSSRSSRRC